MSAPPTTGEMKIMLDDFKEAIGTKIDNVKYELTNSINRVEAQTTKTNGRTTVLEKWMWVCIGGGAVILAIVIPMAIYIWNVSQNIGTTVSTAVENSINQKYDVNVR